MTDHGDDCYFFYYSTCTKGDDCPFRHCEAAMGSEIVCNLWQQGRCFRTVCKFRHMEITKNRKEIPCYWETQPAGCQKPHCAFSHERPRYIDGIFVPPDKSLIKKEEQPYEEPAPPPATTLPTTANPQLRGVIKTETQEPVPSPTHPPVVINPADDDEDEDEEGEVGVSPRKLPKSDDSMNFGVSTLEEIRLRKALTASLRKAGYPIQSSDTSANGEKENILSYLHPTFHEDGPLVFEETVRPRVSVAERLGRRMPNTDVRSGEAVPLKRGLAGRLGRVVVEEEPLMPPQKALKPVRDRLGLPVSVAATQPAETNMKSQKSPEQVRIKTLEEIKQEKAAKNQSQKDDPSVIDPEINKTKNTKGVKRTITVRDDSISHVKTFSEILHAKKRRLKEQEQNPSPVKIKDTEAKSPGRNNEEPDTTSPGPEATNIGQVRVKTLEEIRREKAAKIQVQQALEAENKKSSDTEQNDAKKPHLLRIKKLASQSNVTTEKSAEVTEKPQKTLAAAPEITAGTSNSVKVKTFEEIMREKRLRKQEMEEQAKGSAEAEPAQREANEGTLKRKVPARVTLASPSSTTLAPDSTPSTQKLPVGKQIPLKASAAAGVNSTTPGKRGGAVKAATSVPVKRSASPLEAETESDPQSPSCSMEVPDENTRSSTTLSPAKKARAVPRGPTAGACTSDKTLNINPKKAPEHTADTKVRPKLNVKPSVMKPALQVKPGQKKKGAKRSAVAAVKPLNSASTVLEEPQQETTCRDRQEIPSSNTEAQLSSAVPSSPSNLLDSGSSPLRGDLQTVPVFKQNLSQETKQTVTVAAAREACPVPQSPVLKSPTQPKSRRQSDSASRTAPASSVAASTSAVDDFDDLINEFTDDHLDEDMDPGIGEDDLLQELSEMIDS